jgi:peptide/nickel transport system permease protein
MTGAPQPSASPAQSAGRGPASRAWVRALLGSPASAASLAWLLIVIVVSAFAEQLAPRNPLQQDLGAISQGPSVHDLLGTDELGRDVLSRLMFGGGTLLWGAAEATFIAFLLGVPAGMLAGYAGGTWDRLLSWLADLSFALPAFIVVVALAVIYPQNVAILMGALGVISSGGVLRLTRNLTRAVRAELYVDAARISALRRRQILIRHILPVIAPQLVVQACLGMSVGVIVLASLSFLGLGTNPETPNWGEMIYDASQQVTTHPWLMVPSGAALVLTIMALNIAGSSVRDLAPGTAPLAAGRPRPPARGAGHALLLRLRRREVRPAASPAARADQAGPLLEVRDLTVAFPGPAGLPQPVVDQVSFDVGAGQAFGLVGESGCGKTLSVLSIPGLVPAPGMITARSVRFGGAELAGAGERAVSRLRGSQIGYISQDPMAALDPSFTIGSQLRQVIRRHSGCSRRDAKIRCVQALGEVGIADPATTARLYPHQVSGGMAQRIAIARALAGQPRLLIADEPTTALDVTVQAEILDLLRELKERRGMALILVTHDLAVVADSCERVAVMYAGQIVEQGSAQDVLAAPRHPYTAGLLSSMPDAGTPGASLAAIPGTVPAPKDWPVWCRFEPRCPLAASDCRAVAVELTEAGPGRVSRCLHVAELTGPASR